MTWERIDIEIPELFEVTNMIMMARSWCRQRLCACYSATHFYVTAIPRIFRMFYYLTQQIALVIIDVFEYP
jgi:hypothetical protein